MCKPAHASTHAWMCVEIRVQFWGLVLFTVCALGNPYQVFRFGSSTTYKAVLPVLILQYFQMRFYDYIHISIYVGMCLCECHMCVQVATGDKRCWIPRADCYEPSSLAAEIWTRVFVEAGNTLSCGSLILDFWCLFRKAGSTPECPVKG